MTQQQEKYVSELPEIESNILASESKSKKVELNAIVQSTCKMDENNCMKGYTQIKWTWHLVNTKM